MISNTSNASVGETLKRQLSLHSKFASSDVPCKFKRRKVCRVRDFPKAFERLATHTNQENSMTFIGTGDYLLQKIDGVSDQEDENSEPIELDFESQENVVTKTIFPRYKASAVRDFPKAFEHFIRGNWKSNGGLTSLGAVENSLNKKGSTGKSEDDLETSESDNGSQENIIQNEILDLSDKFDSDGLEKTVALNQKESFLVGVDFLKTLDYAESDDILQTLEHKMTDDFSKICFPQRRVRDIRSFPPKCGRNARRLRNKYPIVDAEVKNEITSALTQYWRSI